MWRAHHAFIPEKRVALKFPRDDSVLAWLRREGLIQARLHHPTIVQVFGGELDGETPYIAMELVEGGDLRGALADGPLEVERTRRIARDPGGPRHGPRRRDRARRPQARERAALPERGSS